MKKGQQIKVAINPFNSVKGQIIDVINEERVRVKLNMRHVVGFQHTLEVDFSLRVDGTWVRRGVATGRGWKITDNKGIPVFIFEGGEAIDNENVFYLEEWNDDNILEELASLGFEINQELDWNRPHESTTLGDTLHIVNDKFAQITSDPIDGGMAYIVRC